MMLSISHVLIGHLYVIFEEIPIWFFAHFGIVCLFVIELQEFFTSSGYSLSNIWLANIFSHFVVFLFFYFWWSPLIHKHFLFLCQIYLFFGCAMWLVRSYFPNQGSNPAPWQWKSRVLTTGLTGNSLVICAFDVRSQILLLNQRSWRFIHKFFSKCFIILVLTLRFLVYFELIFVYDIKKGSSFTVLHVSIQSSENNLLTKIFPCWMVLAPFN